MWYRSFSTPTYLRANPRRKTNSSTRFCNKLTNILLNSDVIYFKRRPQTWTRTRKIFAKYNSNKNRSNSLPLCNNVTTILLRSIDKWKKSFFVVWALCRKMYIHCVSAHAGFASLQLDWATTMGRRLGPITCLPHKDRGIPLSALPKGTTSKLAGLFSTLTLFWWAPSKEAANTIFKSLLVWLDLGNESQVYRLRSGRSNHYAITPVMEKLGGAVA